MSTKQKLLQLESILIEMNAPVLKHFNVGLPQEEVIAFLDSQGIPAIPSLVALYEWHNGVKTVYGFLDAELELLPFGKLFNLDEMVQMRTAFEEWAEDYSDTADNYVPFLGSGESDMFLLDLTTQEVLAFQPMIQTFGERMFRSIDSMLDCILECFEKGAFTIVSEKGLEKDFEAYWQILEKHLAQES